ncbi:MAG: hypothetical protein IMF06_06405 [Proteobacteria bacterium]|nr:hypothetical protein [Pseudomonadota bacterium]
MNEDSVDDKPSRWCVLLPCCRGETWAVPQNCLAEIVTLPSDSEEPPAYLNWRGQEVPVVDLDPEHDSPWRDARAGTGLVAVMLGLKGGAWEYCGVALRGEGLGMKDLASEVIEDAPEQVLENCLSAFRMGGEIYQVPKLQELHARSSTSL